MPCGSAAELLSRSLRIPFVVTVHGLDVFNACAGGGIPAIWRRKVSQKVYAAAKVVICISGRVQENLKAGAIQAGSSVVHNSVDPDLFSPGHDHERPINPEILVVGTLLESKGHGLVLRAIGKLKASYSTIRCRIVGEGPHRAHFEAVARDLGIEQNIQFVGRQSRQEVASAMRHCSAFVLPSHNEGLGCVYLEAMACGKPVIGCQGQGIDEVIEDGKNGWLIPANGLDELVERLSTLLASPELGARVGAAARQTVLNQFTLSHQARELIAVYRQAIE
jgi:glycosyltransferase involved in cell wall biosynthesis